MSRVISVVALLLAPSAMASGTFVAGPASLTVRNGHNTNCAEAFSDLCLASTSGSDPASTRLNTTQDVELVAIVLDGDEVEEILGFDLLPDAALRIDGSTFRQEHPVFRVLVKHVHNTSAPGPLSDFGILMSREGWGFSYHGPSWDPSDGPEFGRHGFYHRFTEEGYVTYDRIGSPELGNNTLDRFVHGFTHATFLDRVENVSPGTRDEIQKRYRAAAPDVEYGLSFREAIVATNASLFATGAALGERESPAPPLAARRAIEAPSQAPRAGSTPSTWLPPPLRPVALEPTSAPLPRAPAPEARVLAQQPPAPVPPGDAAPLVIAGAALLLVLVGAALYFRIRTRDAALASEPRARILERLAREGPVPLSVLAHEMGVDRSTILYHARLLKRMGEVTIVKEGRSVYVALPGQGLTPSSRAARDATAAQVVDAIRRHGGALTREALHASLAHLPQRTRNAAIRRLVELGAVRVVRPPEVIELSSSA